MWIDPITLDVVTTFSEMRALRPDWSGPADMTEENAAELKFAPVVPVKPEYDPETQKAVELTPKFIDDVWTQDWEVTDLDPEFVASRLKAAKLEKRAQINAWRERANYSTFPFAGKLIACDNLSRSDIDATSTHIALFGEFPDNFPGGWKAIDDTYVLMPTVGEFKSMYKAMSKQGTTNFTQSQALKELVTAATTLAEVNAIQWQESTK